MKVACECQAENLEKKVDTTDADFQVYKDSVKYWIEYFGLFGWQIYFSHKEVEGSFAELHYDLEGRCCTFVFNKKWPEDCYNNEHFRHSGFHEVCELLLCRINSLARARFLNAEEIDEEIHNLIRVLENKIFKGK